MTATTAIPRAWAVGERVTLAGTAWTGQVVGMSYVNLDGQPGRWIYLVNLDGQPQRPTSLVPVDAWELGPIAARDACSMCGGRDVSPLWPEGIPAAAARAHRYWECSCGWTWEEDARR